MPPKKASGAHAPAGNVAESPGSDSMPLAATMPNGNQGIAAPPPFDALSPPPPGGVALPGGGTNGGGSWAPYGGVALPGFGASQHDSQPGSDDCPCRVTAAIAASTEGEAGRKKKQPEASQQSQGQSVVPVQPAQMAIDPALLDGPFSAGASTLSTPADAVIVPAASVNASVALQNAAAMDGEDTAMIKAEPRDEEEPFDVMTGAGIDLKAEQEAIAGPSRTGQAEASTRRNGRPAGADPTRGGLFMNRRWCLPAGIELEQPHGRPRFWPDRKGKRRRTEAEEEQRIPLFKQEIISNPELQLSAIEKVDRHHDMKAKQRRKERDEKMQAAIEAEARGEAVGDTTEGEAAPLNASLSAAAKKSLTNPKHATAEVSKKLADSIANTAFGGGPLNTLGCLQASVAWEWGRAEGLLQRLRGLQETQAWRTAPQRRKLCQNLDLRLRLRLQAQLRVKQEVARAGEPQQVASPPPPPRNLPAPLPPGQTFPPDRRRKRRRSVLRE
ncbi:hypothetical protein U1Q18_051464 [Sarracenia purpurea var. burkii]